MEEQMRMGRAGRSEDVPQWQQDLGQVGLVRRLLLARKWYGGDWWFVLLSAILLLGILALGIAPQVFAPYDPKAEVGPSLLSPGETPNIYVLIVRQGQEGTTLREIGGRENRVGFAMGGPASQVLRQALTDITDQDRAAGQNVRYQPRKERFESDSAGLVALQDGLLDGFVMESHAFRALEDEFAGLAVGSHVTEEAGRGFVLGTNQIGQDILSRTIWGTRIALLVGLSSALASVLLGVPLGLISGFVGGWTDRVLTLVMDSLYSFPGLILAIAIAAVLGAGIGNIIVAISVLYIPTYFRIVRGQTLSVKEELYVEAARSLGASSTSLLWRYIFPNVIPSVVIIFSVNVADAILTEAGLSFLGFGLPPDTPDWGIDLARGQDYIRRAWWLITVPGLMVSMVTLAFSMLGESLSEILNPRLAEV